MRINRRVTQASVLAVSLLLSTFAVRALRQTQQLTLCAAIVVLAMIVCCAGREYRRAAAAVLISFGLVVSTLMLTVILGFGVTGSINGAVEEVPSRLFVVTLGIAGVSLAVWVNAFYFFRFRAPERIERAATCGYALAILLMDIAW